MAALVNLEGFGPLGTEVVARVIHATARPDYASTMIVPEAAAAAGVAAIASNAPVVTDVEMVRAGLSGMTALCGLVTPGFQSMADAPATPASSVGLTRTAAGMRAVLEAHPEGALVVVGCAPTALDEVVDRFEAGDIRPALVVATPVGFVGADDSKERLRQSGLLCISNAGSTGGSAVATAIVNALGRLARG